MRFAIVVVLFLMWPFGLSAAENVVVTSGEHEDYTRLVFATSPNREWRLEFGENSAILVFPQQDLVFADEKIFTRIPKTRLVSTSSRMRRGISEYQIALACDCDVSAFSYLDAYIVVDISDRSDPLIVTPNARHTAPAPLSSSLIEGEHKPPEFVSWALPVAPTYNGGLDKVNLVQQGDDLEVLGLAPTQESDAPPSDLQDNKPASENVTTEFEDFELVSEDTVQQAVEVARSSLLQQLTLAADQGLLDLNEPGSDPQPATIGEDVVVIEEILTEQQRPENKNQVLIQTVYSRDTNQAAKDDVPASNHCPTDESLDVASWGSGVDFSGEISIARKRLLGEFDEPNSIELERLVKTYIRYGFGAEAISYLSNGNLEISKQRLLRDLAAIVDGKSAWPDGLFRRRQIASVWLACGRWLEAIRIC